MYGNNYCCIPCPVRSSGTGLIRYDILIYFITANEQRTIMEPSRINAFLQAACAGLGFDIGEVWLHKGSKQKDNNNDDDIHEISFAKSSIVDDGGS